jgi:hypothetical protein
MYVIYIVYAIQAISPNTFFLGGMSDCSTPRGILREEARLSGGDEEEMILGIHVYRVLSPTRFACSLMPSGASGIVEFSAISLLGDDENHHHHLLHQNNNIHPNPLVAGLSNATPESPVTMVFRRAIPAPHMEWSSERKCFHCQLPGVQAFLNL